MNVRYAFEHDLPKILSLLDELGYPTNIQELIYRFEIFSQTIGYGIAICELNQQIVGFIAWSKSNLFISDATRIHIEALIVTNSYKKKGIGKKLIKFVENFAKQFNSVIIDLTSGMRRKKEGSHKFYERLGFKNKGLNKKLYLRKYL